MHVIENPEEFRQKISKKLEKILDDEPKIAENLEKGIYNFCIKEAGERNIVKKSYIKVYNCMFLPEPIVIDKF